LAKLESFSLSGLDLWFHSLDHLPPHFHVRKPGEWEIRVNFLSCIDGNLDFTVKWQEKNRLFSQQEKRMLVEAISENRVGLLEEWERKVSQGA